VSYTSFSSFSHLSLSKRPVLNYDDLFSSSQNNLQDMHLLHPSYMFNTSEVSNEYNLLNNFLNNSLMDDGSFYGDGDFHNMFSNASLMNPLGTSADQSTFHPSASRDVQLLPPPAQTATSDTVRRPPKHFFIDKAREKYLTTAADPAGTDSPEERMNKLLRTKMDAGLLRPFNYVKGYARLNQYMEQNLKQTSRVRVLRQLDRFRPKFRERMEKLTDVDLVRIEMWFDKSLMEYDRVFASMAIPACCWRRTGEIYRGNKEMARLIHAPMSKLRDVCAVRVDLMQSLTAARVTLLYTRSSPKTRSSPIGRSLVLLRSTLTRRRSSPAAPSRTRTRHRKIPRFGAASRSPSSVTYGTCEWHDWRY
jgi:hypothetical protein